ncbi:cytochrome P450 [Patulibacter sp.]|uniref:cytochrome P450 n=1 Tax=Patulibacter sp. TaxID=1912859 RepID=UPI002728F0F2|nr:cytochrome P450 [Patulibacter sp.]MDO9406949.1 cytochrome P450 [Patulibacter sp.]
MSKLSVTPLEPSVPPRLPAGPRLPTLVSAALFAFARRPFFTTLQRRYGDAFSIPLPGIGRAVVVCHPDLVKAVFTADAAVLHAGENPLGDVLGRGSIFALDEEDHLRERRLLLPAFHGDRMRVYEELVEEEALRAMAAWPDGEEFPTLPSFNAITLRVILRAVFGAAGDELDELEDLLPEATALGQRMVVAPALRRDLGRRSPGGRLKRLRSRYEELVGRLIDGCLADPELSQRTDVLAMMLQAGQDGGGEVDRTAVANELLTLLVAGHETTASSLAYAVERLRRHPLVLRRLEEEAETGDSTYRAATILELLRHRTIIGGTGRRAVVPVQLGEWRIPARTMLFPALATIHDDTRFHAHAEGFDPGRYVDAKPGTYTWVPFGGGRRRCLGASFALFELEIVLRTMLRHFDLEPTNRRAERQSFRGLAYAPSDGGLAVVRRRPVPRHGDAVASVATEVPRAAAAPAAAAGCPVAH